MIITGVPPLDLITEHLPKPIADLFAELADMRTRVAEVNRRRDESVAAGPTGATDAANRRNAAAAADERLAAEAVRAGRDPAEVGTPNQDRLAQGVTDVAKAKADKATMNLAFAQVSADLVDTIADSDDDAFTDLDQFIAESADVCVSAVESLREARYTLSEAQRLRDFLDFCRARPTQHFGYQPARHDDPVIDELLTDVNQHRAA